MPLFYPSILFQERALGFVLGSAVGVGAMLYDQRMLWRSTGKLADTLSGGQLPPSTPLKFKDVGCENCPFFNMDHDHDRVLECTTPNFAGVISCMDPASSWAARWLRISKFLPGCYALTVTGELSEEMQAICEDNKVRYVPRS